MHTTRRITSLRRSTFAGGLAMAAALVLSSTTPVTAGNEDSQCFAVRGEFDENAVDAGCTSPAGICFEGRYFGSIRGPFAGQVVTLVPTVDPATSNVLLFNSESEIQAQVRGRTGTLIVRNSGAFEVSGEGHIVDLQSIIGGTGELAGASGTLRASGLFAPETSSGSSRYRGTLCLPRP